MIANTNTKEFYKSTNISINKRSNGNSHNKIHWTDSFVSLWCHTKRSLKILYWWFLTILEVLFWGSILCIGIWNTSLELITLSNDLVSNIHDLLYQIVFKNYLHICKLARHITGLYLHILRLRKSNVLEWRWQHFKKLQFSPCVTQHVKKTAHKI